MSSKGRGEVPPGVAAGDHPNDVSTDLENFEGDPAARLEPDSRVYLVAREAGRSWVIDLDDMSVVTVGRAPESTIVVDSTRVSRQHARIARKGTLVVVEDLGSRNATRVGGTTLRGGRQALLGGELVRIGPLELTVAIAARAPCHGHGRLEAELGRVAEEGGPATRETPETTASVVLADRAMVKLYDVARRLAHADTTILILGETGAGKEILAEHIHHTSPRAKGPFIRLSCASLPETLLESELFGHERGAFTGADRRRVGYLEAAQGGTLLLDEIGELPLGVQAKLLRTLETRRAARVGGTQDIELDIRFLCATHRDLQADVAAGRFRQDLYYRVRAFTLKIPALRDRPTEIALLTRVFVRDFAAKMRLPLPEIDQDVMALLMRHGWPGNVRELRHALEHAVVLSEGGPIRPEHLPDDLTAGSAPLQSQAAPSAGMRDELAEMERLRILQALELERYNQTRAAERLGISRRTLVYKLAKYGIRR